ncbi:CBS domain-containing protein [Stappia sp. F7233]|uniref:CBS domain-containing protein n=1 Tax=Stappia albiluteola TaxID=2758565 RepID=A0A839AKT9_9HYPH|nr:CBS domain-containing protein [Stappia albiluteola]MBA5779417.1 CBS domain-containing protein [Stappia albiluteola]
MKISEVMHRGASSVGPDAAITKIAKIMSDMDVGSIPVAENGRVIGIVTDRDIALRAVANGKDVSRLTARDIMSSKVNCCRELEDLDTAARMMERNHIRRLPVLDDNDRLVGMVSLGDVCHAASQRLTADVVKAVSAHHA